MRLKISITLFILVAVSCNKSEYGNTDIVTVPEAPININTFQQSKGYISYNEVDMNTVGVYCSHTGQSNWDSQSSFKKLDNRKYSYSNDLKEWIINGTPEPWGHNELTDKYTFYAYSPYAEQSINGIKTTIEGSELVIDYSVPQICKNQPDLLFAIPRKNIYPQIGGKVALTFKHTLSLISFSVKSEQTDTISKIIVSGVKNQGRVTWDYKSESPKWTYLVESQENNEYEVSIADYKISNDTNKSTLVTAKDGYLMMIPQKVDNGVKIEVVINGNESLYLNIPDGTEWLAGESYNYVINLIEETAEIIFDKDQISNCYIINPTTDIGSTVQIPIQGRINDFWENYTTTSTTPITEQTLTTELYAEMLWEDFDDDIDYECTIVRDKDNEMAVRVALPSNAQAGNTVFTVSDSENRVLWSWHLWVTDYNPDAIAKVYQNEVTQQENVIYTYGEYEGAVHHYKDASDCSKSEAVWSGIYSDKFIMDRNVGSRSAEYVSNYGAGVLYYQFGRKDPFPGNVIRYKDGGRSVITDSNSPISFEKSVNEPGVYYYTSSNRGIWCSEDDTKNTDILWYDKNAEDCDYVTGKSIFDPSPLGWRVPVNGTWNYIDNTGSSQDGYNGEEVFTGFYPAQGYRFQYNSILLNTGISSNVWSATPRRYNKGYSLYYSEEYIYGSQSENSGCGLSVRCVQE